jgi:serine/threonine protein kinase
MERTCSLIAHAVALGLVQPREVQRHTSSVARRVHDAAASDLVWADELVSAGLLTRYQADALLAAIGGGGGQAARPLALARLQVLQLLRNGDLGATYLCRDRSGDSFSVRVPCATDPQSLPVTLDATLARWRELGDERIVVPDLRQEPADSSSSASFLLVRRWVPGRSLADLLQHGAYLPERAALALLGELLELAGQAAANGLVHGDWRPSNVVLRVDGRVAVLDAGLRGVDPSLGLLLSRDLPPDRYAYVAPPVACAEGPATEQSEVYALGCLLHHMLTGQPPFRGGDARRIIEAHRRGRLPESSPATTRIAATTRELLRAMLGIAGVRVEHAAEVAERLTHLRGPQSQDRRHWRISTVLDGSSRPPDGRPHWGRLGAALATLALTVAGTGWFGRAALPRLSIRTPFDRTPLERPAEPDPPAAAPAAGVVRLGRMGTSTAALVEACRNAPAGAVIEISSAGPFRLDGLVLNKPVVIRGDRNVRPLLVGGPGACLQVVANDVRFENLHFVRLATALTGEPADPSGGLIRVQVDRFGIADCSFQTFGAAPETAAVHWVGSGAGDARMEIANTYFSDMAAAVLAARGGRYRLTFENCSHFGPGPLTATTSSAGSSLDAIDVVLNQVSVRGTSLLRHEFPEPFDQMLPLHVNATASLFVPLLREQPIVRLEYGGQPPSAAIPRFTWSGQNSLCPADATIAEVHAPRAATSWRIAGVAAWDRYWASRPTGLRGGPLPFESALPPDAAIFGAGQSVGADARLHLCPLPVTLQQLPALIERLQSN